MNTQRNGLRIIPDAIEGFIFQHLSIISHAFDFRMRHAGKQIHRFFLHGAVGADKEGLGLEGIPGILSIFNRRQQHGFIAHASKTANRAKLHQGVGGKLGMLAEILKFFGGKKVVFL